jgi:hypothetical protein
MGTIKDIYDLGKELKESVSERKQLDIVMSILDKIQDAERENFELEKSQFNLERKHHEEVINLKLSHSDEVAILKAKISKLESELESKSSNGARSIPLVRG